MKSLFYAAFSAFFLFAAGCYSDRLTGVYDIASDFQGVDENSGVLEESGRTPEDEARIRDRLTAIAKEEMPVYYLDAGDKIEVRVYDHPDLGVTTRIGPDGTIGFAFMGHVKLAGGCPVAWLEKLPGRVPSIHAKPGGGNSVGGAGDANDWKAIFSAAAASGTKWAIVECETRRNTFADVEASMNFLRGLQV